MDNLLKKLNDLDMAGSGWLNTFKTLTHDCEHHMDKEESGIFGCAPDVIPDDRIDGYGTPMKKRAASLADGGLG